MVTPERKPVFRSLFWAGAWAALASTSSARADFVTPDSIPQPPPTIAYANGTPIPIPADLVTNQYVGRGLQFPYVNETGRVLGAPFAYSTAITNLNGIDVWTPAYSPIGTGSVGMLDYPAGLTVQLVKPGGTTPTTATSLTVEILHLPNTLPLELIALDRSGDVVGDITASSGMGPHGGELLTLSAANISSFQLGYEATIGGESRFDVPWGVAGIEFTPSPAPEPGGLALAVFGAAALAGWTWRFRRKTPALAA